ncbi:MAG: four helix bundle protein [Bacteroidetes bacterium]|nr:four helix bundle protein [Bacteroidota bacterium]
MKKENVLRDKSFSFALRIIKCFKYLQGEQKEYILSKQLLRCGTSIGANIREAEQAQSKIDFIHKLSISLKEANETAYWLELLYQAGYLDHKIYENIYQDCSEVLKLLTSIIKTSKQNSGH